MDIFWSWMDCSWISIYWSKNTYRPFIIIGIEIIKFWRFIGTTCYLNIAHKGLIYKQKLLK